MKSNLCLYLIIAVVFISCTEKYTILEEQVLTVDKSKTKGNSVLKDSILNFNYSRLTTPGLAGIEADFKVKEDWKDKDLRIVFKGKGRTNQVYTNSAIVISILQGDSNKIFLWKTMPLKYAYTDVNKWCWFSDSIDIVAKEENKTFNYISAFTYLNNTLIEKFDLDTLIVQVKYKL